MDKNLFLRLPAIILLLTFSFHFSLFAQIEDYYNEENMFSQKEGTEDILREYFSCLDTDADTLYVLLYVPGLSLRLEAPINSFDKQLKRADSNAQSVLLSVELNPNVARKYNERLGFKADHYMYDGHNRYLDFLSFSTMLPAGACIMKIARSSGRVICSVRPIDFREGLYKALVNVHEISPFHTFANIDNDSFGLPSDLRAAKLNYAAHELLNPDTLFIIGNMRTLPALKDGLLVFRDDFNLGFSCFRSNGSGGLDFAKRIMPEGDERTKYMKLTDEQKRDYIDNGYAYWIALMPIFLPDGKIGAVFDLPEVTFEDGCYMSSNFPAILVRDANDFTPSPMFGFSDNFFYEDSADYDYEFFNIDVIDNKRFVVGVTDIGWPRDGFSEFEGNPKHDPFMDEFYDYTDRLCLQLVDAETGEKIRKFHPLPDHARETMTGYCFVSNCATSHGNEIAYTTSYSGKVFIADNETPWDVKREYTVFNLDPSRKPELDPSKFYTYEYANIHLPYFCRHISSMRLTGDKLHVLVKVTYSFAPALREPVFEYRRIDRNTGEIEASFMLEKQHEGETLLGANLSYDDEPQLFYVSELDGKYFMTLVSANE